MSTDPTASEILDLKKKLEENSDSLIFAVLADAYRKQGNLTEAFNVCRKGLEKHPSYTSARIVLGRINQAQGKIEDAASNFKKVLEIDPENLMAHALLGSIYMEENDYQTAIEEYQKVLTLNPDDEEAQSSLKRAIEKAAGEQKSIKFPQKETSPEENKNNFKETTSTLTIAELYLKQGHYDKAIEVYQELLADDPQNLMLRQKLSEVVERHQKEVASNTTSSKLKKSEFIQPPDQKEDTIVDDLKNDSKRPGKIIKDDDSKFTNEDILQVMRKGGKDDVVLEEKVIIPSAKKITVPSAAPVVAEKGKKSVSLSDEQVEGLKKILKDLGAVEGIMRCFLIGNDGNTVVSIGETSNNAELGKQAMAIFQGTQRSVTQLNQGKLQQVLVTAETGHILLVFFVNFVLIALANNKVNLGLLRIALDSALKKSDKIL
jgi:tetratricopeptide (TPR) repeat protein/predicted regulator of Ras-like GTPase activity (Roadblock/LC7/MglB family)